MFEIHFQKTFAPTGRGAAGFSLQVKFKSTHARVVILGPSASGKTLTLKAIAGLLRPDRGIIRLGDTIVFDSENNVNVAPRHRRAGYVFQDYALFPHLTVRQNVAFPLSQTVMNPPKYRRCERVEKWLNKFELQGAADQYPATLSGGQRQRTALARALVAEPKVLLLDEPFSALDHDLQDKTRRELQRLLQTVALPVIMISHDPLDAEMFGETVVRMDGGRVVG